MCLGSRPPPLSCPYPYQHRSVCVSVSTPRLLPRRLLQCPCQLSGLAERRTNTCSSPPLPRGAELWLRAGLYFIGATQTRRRRGDEAVRGLASPWWLGVTSRVARSRARASYVIDFAFAAPSSFARHSSKSLRPVDLDPDPVVYGAGPIARGATGGGQRSAAGNRNRGQPWYWTCHRRGAVEAWYDIYLEICAV